MPGSVTAADEKKLLAAVKEAALLVEGGTHPDEAVEKVARDHAFGPGAIRLVAHGYNTGRQLAQWEEKGASILDKLAHFPLANPDGVIGRIYGEQEKTAAVSDEYSKPPTWLDRPAPLVKAASAGTPPEPPPETPGRRLDRLFAAENHHNKNAQEYDRQASHAEDTVRAETAGLVNYFRQYEHDRLPYGIVKAAAETYFVGSAVALLDLAYEQAHLGSRKEKTAADHGPWAKPVDLNKSPFTFIKAAQFAAQEYHVAKTAAAAQRAKAQEARAEAHRPFAEQPHKAAGILSTPAVGAFLGSMLSRGVGGVPQSNDDMVDKAWMDLEDPEHANELRKIKAHAMLNSMLTDRKDPISGHSPDDVLNAYNEIAQATPRVAETPGTLRPILRRRLEGHTEPFEAKEQLDIEKGLAQAKSPTPNTSLLGDAPDKLLN